MNRAVIISINILILTFGFSCRELPLSVIEFEQHNIHLNLNVPEHQAEVSDEGTVQIYEGWNLFYLNNGAVIQDFKINGQTNDFISFPSDKADQIPSELQLRLKNLKIPDNVQKVFFKSKSTEKADFLVSFSAQFLEDVDNVRFSNEQVGREVTATILERGAYFSPSSYFYPQGTENSANFKITTEIPLDWESISDGNRVYSAIEGNRKIQTWVNPFSSDGVMYMAAPFWVKSTWVDSIEVACYFFEADTGLFDQYLPATADYIRMYSDLIGPYPYERFTVVENFFPTGYGMPGWTLLGQQVLRLPFIVYTSLGHEVLHNWWGNSVYVDYKRGNWCESATVYGADYRYKLMRSPEAAKDYRKDILKQYVSYIHGSSDFPIGEFKSRTSPGTRTIGYNKAMMVWHMIHEEIGDEAFFKAWKIIYKKYKSVPISWSEWITVFEKTSGVSLSHIIPQWIDQAGAPVLDIEITATTSDPGSEKQTISLKLMEKSEQFYRLRIPIRFSGGGTAIDTALILEEEAATYSITVPASVNQVEADPEYHLFRRLYPEEIEPIISAILGYPQQEFVAALSDELEIKSFTDFCNNLVGDSIMVKSYNIFDSSNRNYAPVILNPAEFPGFLNSFVTREDSLFIINSEEYSLAGHTFILTAQNWKGFEKLMVISTTDFQSLPRIGELLPHYGKYSYLVFKGSRNVGKGQWVIQQSPLKKRL